MVVSNNNKKMEIVVLRKMEYEGLMIYIMQFANAFQYLFAVDGDIYQNYIEMKPSFKQKFLYKIYRAPSMYTPDQLDEGEKLILSGAMETIDKLKAEGKFTRQASKTRTRDIEKIKEHKKKVKDVPCEWQALETTDGFYYRCLIHGDKVKVGEEGDKPHHD